MRKTFIGKKVVILYPKDAQEENTLQVLLATYGIQYLSHVEGGDSVYVLFYTDWCSIPTVEQEKIEGQLTR